MWLINLPGSREGGISDAMERIWSQTCPGVFIITGDWNWKLLHVVL